MTRLAILCGLLAASLLPAQNCNNTSIGAIPLTELGTGTYQGFPGGLYPSGANTPPPAHQLRALAATSRIQPLDAQGNPDPLGRIVLLSVGMSNTTQEFSTWLPIANGDPNRNPRVTIVDGAQGGQTAAIVSDPTANFWTVIDQRLAAAGASRAQVQAVWLKEANARPTDPFPQHAQTLQGHLAQIARNLHFFYPNVQLCFLSSRTYGGYATTTLNPEPYAYESGFACKWTIEQQIQGDPQLNCDPVAGPVLAPCLLFGPYLWADGTTPRTDGLTWQCADFSTDGTHPSTAGRQKVATLLQQFFTGSPFATPWYLGGGGGTAAAAMPFGAGCAGVAGVPEIVTNGQPRIGNLNFRIGVQRAAPNRFALLMLSLAQSSIPLTGSCTLLLDPALGLPTDSLFTTAAGNGSIAIPVPGSPALAGFEMSAQWGVEDPAGSPLPPLAGLAMTRGLWLRVGF